MISFSPFPSTAVSSFFIYYWSTGLAFCNVFIVSFHLLFFLVEKESELWIRTAFTTCNLSDLGQVI